MNSLKSKTNLKGPGATLKSTETHSLTEAPPSGVSSWSGPEINITKGAGDSLSLHLRIPLCSLGLPPSTSTTGVGGSFTAIQIYGRGSYAATGTLDQVECLGMGPTLLPCLLTIPTPPTYTERIANPDCALINLIAAAFSKYRVKGAMKLHYLPTTTTLDPTNFALAFTDDPMHPQMGFGSYTVGAGSQYANFGTTKNSVNSIVFASWSTWSKSFPVDNDTVYYTTTPYVNITSGTPMDAGPPFYDANLRFSHFGALQCFVNDRAATGTSSVPKGELYYECTYEFFDFVPVTGAAAIPFSLTDWNLYCRALEKNSKVLNPLAIDYDPPVPPKLSSLGKSLESLRGMRYVIDDDILADPNWKTIFRKMDALDLVPYFVRESPDPDAIEPHEVVGIRMRGNDRYFIDSTKYYANLERKGESKDVKYDPPIPTFLYPEMLKSLDPKRTYVPIVRNEVKELVFGLQAELDKLFNSLLSSKGHEFTLPESLSRDPPPKTVMLKPSPGELPPNFAPTQHRNPMQSVKSRLRSGTKSVPRRSTSDGRVGSRGMLHDRHLTRAVLHLKSSMTRIPKKVHPRIEKAVNTVQQKSPGWQDTAKGILKSVVKEVPMVGGILSELTDVVAGPLLSFFSNLF